MTTPALTCRELVELVTDYLDGALDYRIADALEAQAAATFRPTARE